MKQSKKVYGEGKFIWSVCGTPKNCCIESSLLWQCLRLETFPIKWHSGNTFWIHSEEGPPDANTVKMKGCMKIVKYIWFKNKHILNFFHVKFAWTMFCKARLVSNIRNVSYFSFLIAYTIPRQLSSAMLKETAQFNSKPTSQNFFHYHSHSVDTDPFLGKILVCQFWPFLVIFSHFYLLTHDNTLPFLFLSLSRLMDFQFALHFSTKPFLGMLCMMYLLFKLVIYITYKDNLKTICTFSDEIIVDDITKFNQG